MTDKPIIEPERAGLWAAVAFIIALIAFVMAFAAMQQVYSTQAVTQMEIVALNKKIEDMKGGKPAAPATSAAPATAP